MIADKKIKELENSSVELTVTVPAATVEEAYQTALKKYAQQIQIKGFRKGKAPVSVLESKYGKAISEESTFGAIEDAVKEAIDSLEDKKKPLPYSTPALQDEDKLLPFQANSDVTFSVVYDVMPEVTLPVYTGLTVGVPKVEISDELVNKEIDKLRDQNALVVDKDGAAANGDIVTIDYAELDADGNEVAGTARKDFVFTIGSGYNFYKIDEDVVGMAKGDSKTIAKTYADDSDIPGYAGKTITLKVDMKQVKVRDIPALDDEFAQDVKEEYKTVADLVADTKKKLEENLTSRMEETKLNALFDEMLKNTAITVPASMVDLEVEQNWNKFVRQSGLNEEQVLQFLQFQNQSKESVMNEWREGAERTLRIQLMMEKIKETENFPVDDKELEDACAEQLKDVEDEDQKKYYRDMIKDDLQFRQVSKFLLEKNTFNEDKTVSYDDFIAGKLE